MDGFGLAFAKTEQKCACVTKGKAGQRQSESSEQNYYILVCMRVEVAVHEQSKAKR